MEAPAVGNADSSLRTQSGTASRDGVRRRVDGTGSRKRRHITPGTAPHALDSSVYHHHIDMLDGIGLVETGGSETPFCNKNITITFDSGRVSRKRPANLRRGWQ